jgi:hypothetical protein
MGGIGSGNDDHWWRQPRKTTVAECRALDIRLWRRDGGLQAGVWQAGSWRWWHDAARARLAAAVGFEVDTGDPADPWVRLFHNDTDTGDLLDYRIDLQTTRLHSGGRRWWFTCPLVVDGTPFRRRVGQLYLPPGGRYFGCWHCHGLTYTSCQESHKYDATARRLAAALGEDFRKVRRGLARRGKLPWWLT